jgi:hypothetical protein
MSPPAQAVTSSETTLQHDALSEGFSHRPLGTRAVPTGTDLPALSLRIPVDNPCEAVLRLGAARVVVGSIQRRNDGSFSGAVERFEVDGAASLNGVAVGDQVTFRESHIFTFRASDQGAPSGPVTRKPVDRRRTPPAVHHAVLGAELDRERIPVSRRWAAGMKLGAALAIGLGLGYVLPQGLDTRSARPAGPSVAPGLAKLKIDYELRPRTNAVSAPTQPHRDVQP